ncbi:MAG TPA: RHS repeat protein, partial [Candidatus Caccenecus avistercoris]|nr:RHS repeat protein [Candidatus Caccenecus avistercoris]
MKELKHLRKRNEKHFLNDDGTISLYLYNNDIHYLKNGEYLDIDNTLIEKGNTIINKANNFHTSFSKDKNTNLLVDITKDNYYLKIYLLKAKNNNTNIKRNKQDLIFENILEDIDIDYKVISTKLKESIILKNKNNIPSSLSFKIDTNLVLELATKGSIIAKDKDKNIFVIDAPFMKDNSGSYNYNINYDLNLKDNTYYLNLNLDQEWLNKAEFPVIIDPTIVNKSELNVYDTYIYLGDDNVDRNNTDKLKVGVASNNIVYRSLLKFDLPTIGTGYDIIKAYFNLISHADDRVALHDLYHENITVHEVNTNWTEDTANWNTMNDKFENKVEDFGYAYRTILDINPDEMGYIYKLQTSTFDITNLVKKWYSGSPNYGVMLKFNKEVYNEDCPEYTFYSKNNNISEEEEMDNPKPYLVITYRNQNGLEDYMTYQTQEYTDGASYINNLTGNLTTVFNLNETISGKYPINLSLIYNTNDVVLNKDYGYKAGYKFNLNETIEEVTIDNNNYLEYTDADGTIHYFRNELDDEGNKIDNKYIDEDGLGLKATKENNDYIVTDIDNNEYRFTLNNNIYYLTKLTNTNKDTVTIFYDTSNRINKITDANNSSINITYNTDNTVISSDSTTTTINYTNNKITNIVTKNGTTSFIYNNNGLIEKIMDVNGLSKYFTYYETSPYKVKKITEYGLNNEQGASLEFDYGFLVTRVKDNKNRYNTYIFNEQGNTIGITNLNEEANLNNAYGKGTVYENNTTYKENNGSYFEDVNRAGNKIANEILAVKYTKNLIKNSSFEDEETFFIGTRTTEEKRTGSYSLKFSDYCYFEDPSLPPRGRNYTFSGYFKNDKPLTMSLERRGLNKTDTLDIISIPPNEDFAKYSVTGDYPSSEEEGGYISVTITSNEKGTAYLDDIQLEEGEIANYYNMLENGDFHNGLEGWEVSAHDKNGNEYSNVASVVTLDGGVKALKIASNPDLDISVDTILKVNGIGNLSEDRVGDLYNLSFWYKNEGLPKSGSGMEYSNSVLLSFYYTNIPEDMGYGLDPIGLPSHNNEWQYFSAPFPADSLYNYDTIALTIFSNYNANNLYIANITLSKDIEQSYNYHNSENGNLEGIRNMDSSHTSFTYDENNQLTSMFNPLGNNFKFEYDNTVTDRVLKGISPSGISNEILYDDFGNPIKTLINNVNPDQDVIDGKTYYIRLKGSQKYWDSNFITNEISLKEDNCSHDAYLLTKEGDYYRIKSGEEYVTLINNSIGLTKLINDDSLFRLSLQNNNSYIIIPKTKDNTLLEHNLACVNDKLSLKTEDTKESEEQFYFEDIDTQLFIESKAEYTLDGKFVTKTIDSLDKVTTYDINTTNGLTNSITDANNITTYYTYNSKDQITKVQKENKEVNYTYNTNNLLSKITSNNKEYNFTYDNFLNAKQIKIGDNITLITNNYENNNGNLLSSVYGNGDTFSYTYDELDRIKTMTNDINTYTYHYDNLGNLAKITSLNENYDYYYDLSSRISKYIANNFNIEYDYDSNNNILKKEYTLNNQETVTFEYNTDDAITKVTFDNNNLNYTYDYLGRLTSKDINGNQKIEYTYITNGNKTSTVLNSMKINNDLYEYYYDNLYNITDIYLNKKLINHYEYDNFNELIKEDDYNLNKTIRYTYDNAGNILKKQEYELDTYNLLHTDTYEYNNINWEDQLTKYNNESITYDEIGNPLTIGNKVLSWVNGRQLASYTDNDLSITYTYNKDGIRTQKKINNTITNYFTENNKIIFEQTGNNMIYYIRDEEGSLIGFKYNNTIYYCIKNMQEDIIGLTDSNHNLLCSYEYDSWG